MSNNIFHFKQFKVTQEKSAMKIGTDGVLLGTWSNISSVKTALDIGTGTGLIALILAQRTEAKIDAVEIDENAFLEARKNIMKSKWDKRINIYHKSFLEFYKSESKKYDLIITNPPYFTNSLKSENRERNLARHNDSLTSFDLLKGVSSLLESTGRFCLIIPFDQSEIFIKEAKNHMLFCNKQTDVKTTPNKYPKRALLEFSFNETKVKKDEIIIEQYGRHKYSEEYINLTKDFYLKM